MKALHNFLLVLRRDPVLLVAATVLVAILVAAIFGLPFTGYTYDQISSIPLAPPSSAHWFGTDENGRDLLTRTLFGAQVSLLIAAFGAVVSLTVGVSYGMISGYAGGRVDNIMMRIVEILYSLPTIVLVIVLVTSLDDPMANFLRSLGLRSISPRLVLIILFLGLTEWFTMARIIRGQVLVLKQQTFIQASQALGQSHLRILWQHLLPNLLGIVAIYLTLTIPAIMLDESFMSFLGVGLQPPLASWGTLVSEGAFLINPIKLYWWMLIFPGGMMTLTLLSLNFLGDGLRDALRFRALRNNSMSDLEPMIPDLQASFACEDVRVETSGAHTVVGILNFIGAPSLPIQVFKLCIWTRWSSGVGTFEQTTRIIGPDEETQLARAATKFTLNDEDNHTTNVNIFGGLQFTQAGTHHVEIILDGELKLRYPVRVMLPPQGQTAPA